MPKSTTRRGFGRSTGTVTVIEAKVHRSSARNARLGFLLTAVVVTVLAMSVASAYMHPILALFTGAAIGVCCGAITWALVRVWVLLRLLWWWTPEIGTATAVLTAWVQLANHTPTSVTLVVAATVVGVPTALPMLRRRVVAWSWCLIVRHRLRVCFTQFIRTNQSGSLPLILWATPTPVGERVWVYLRPGLSIADLTNRLDKIAVTCHAATVLVERASQRNAAFLRFDIKRREVLTATVGSPLVDLIDPATPTPDRHTDPVPTALDLPDVPAQPTTTPPRPVNGRKVPATTSAASSAVPDAGEDINDWI